AVALLQLIAGDADVFVAVRGTPNVAGFARADRATAEKVGDEFIPASIPRVQDRARSAFAVEFFKRVRRRRFDAEFGLQNARGPEQWQRVDRGAIAKPEDQARRGGRGRR